MAETRTVTINADGIQEREVMYVRYELNQQTDVEGQPTGRTRGGKITVKVKSKNDGNTEILEWMKRLNFKNGYVVEYAETYDDKNEVQQYEEFVITAKEIQVGNAVHNNSWTIDK